MNANINYEWRTDMLIDELVQKTEGYELNYGAFPEGQEGESGEGDTDEDD